MKRLGEVLHKILKKGQQKDQKHDDLKVFISLLKATGFADFVRYLQSKRRIIWINFLAGVARGFGIVFGMTIFVAVVVWILNQLVDFPLIGQYFLDLKTLLENIPTIKK